MLIDASKPRQNTKFQLLN